MHNSPKKEMSNQTSLTDFLLLEFSAIREFQILHFFVFLLVYLAALVGNLLVITAVILNHNLHIPMYFFLMNLAILDLGSISVTVPKSMFNSLTNTKSISYSGCVTQVFLLFLFASAGIALLTIMAYDRYIAICQPLHYERVMNRKVCVQMAASAWTSGLLNSALHTGNTFALAFCGDNTVNQFFCEIPQLLKLTCSDSYVSEVGVTAVGACLALGCFVFIVVSYVHIITKVLRMRSEKGRHKAFSTCIPHLIVFSMLLFTGAFVYLKPTSSSTSGHDLIMAVFYSVVPPMINPVIYSMRNTEIKDTVRKLIWWILLTKH